MGEYTPIHFRNPAPSENRDTPILESWFHVGPNPYRFIVFIEPSQRLAFINPIPYILYDDEQSTA